MEWLVYIGPFAAVCIAASIGIERRAPWVWFFGWIFLFFAAGAVNVLGVSLVSGATSTLGFVGACVAYLAEIAVWITGAIWWGTHRDEFRGRPRRKPADASQKNG